MRSARHETGRSHAAVAKGGTSSSRWPAPALSMTKRSHSARFSASALPSSGTAMVAITSAGAATSAVVSSDSPGTTQLPIAAAIASSSSACRRAIHCPRRTG